MEKLREKLLERLGHVAIAREEGQGMVEYALILFLVSIAAIAALTLIGTDVDAVFDAIETALDGVAGG